MIQTSLFDAVKEVITSRRSVRKYDSSYVMPEEDLNEILALAAQAPSSWNLQHWRYLVITSKEQKEKLLPIAFNQQQVVEASATVAILADLEAWRSAYEVYGEALEKGNITKEIYDTMIGQIEGAYKGNPQVAREDAILNASLSAMQLMLAAKAKGYDTCPMGGFDRAKLIEAFNIPERYYPVMLITIGKPAAPGRPTTRFSLEKLVIKDSF